MMFDDETTEGEATEEAGAGMEAEPAPEGTEPEEETV